MAITDAQRQAYKAPVLLQHKGTLRNPNGETYGIALYQCFCGNTFTSRTNCINTGDTKSCGCIKAGMPKKHGLYKHPMYQNWLGIRQRCYNPNDKYYADYGGRGIRMAKTWYNSFEAFYKDMGEKPTPKHSIDRIDTNGHYVPENCRWATTKEQANNKRSSLLLTYNDRTQSLRSWCDELGLDWFLVYHRLRAGWDVERAFTTPVKDKTHE